VTTQSATITPVAVLVQSYQIRERMVEFERRSRCWSTSFAEQIYFVSKMIGQQPNFDVGA